MFIHPFPHAFGIDISDRSVKLVQLKTVERLHSAIFAPLAMRRCELAEGVIVNGIIEQPEGVRKCIENLLRGSGKGQRPIKSPWVVASVPENHSFLKLITIPRSDKGIFEKSDILAAIESQIPMGDMNSYTIDWHIVPHTSSPEYQQVLVGAIKKTVADSYTYLLESLGLGVIALDIEEVAIARAMITARKEYKEEARAIIDIGATRSEVIFYDQDMIQFSTVLPFSGDLLNKLLISATKCTLEEAERLKKEVGLNASQNKKAYTTMVGAVKQFTESLRQTFSAYYGHNKDANRITRIVLCGGASNLSNLDTVLKDELGIECVRGNVWKNLGLDPKQAPMDNAHALSYATALGLALRASDSPFITRDTI